VAQRLADAYPAPMLDFMFETTRAFADLLLAGVPGRWPRIRWIVPHAGAALPSVLDRESSLPSACSLAGLSARPRCCRVRKSPGG